MFDVEVSDASQVGEARRRAAAVAAEAGFDEVHAGQVALAATELATNLVKHASGGHLLVGSEGARIDLLGLDRGRGIANLEACLADGFSTAGTRGAGLGAVRRLAQRFEAISWPGRGTAVFARFLRESAAAPGADFGPGAIVVTMPGQDACGDACCSHLDPAGLTLFVVDGLGHGTAAAVAAQAAVTEFAQRRHEPPAEILAAVHRAMRHTRGGAVAVARLQWDSRTVTFAGLGNIAGSIVGASGPARRMVSHNGTAGHNARRIQAFEYPFGDGVLVMHSDGIGGSWSLDAYPGLLGAHPMLVAGVLYRDFARGSDDAAVVVARTRVS